MRHGDTSEQWNGSESSILLSRQTGDALQANQNGLSEVDVTNIEGMTTSLANSGEFWNCNLGHINQAPALRLHAELRLSDRDLSVFLYHYILTSDLLLHLGYPVESPEYPGRAIIYNDPHAFMLFQRKYASSCFDPNAKEFVPMSANQTTGTRSYSHRSLKKEPQRLNCGTEEKKCARCGRGFFLKMDGEYLTHEQCIYHWGKLRKAEVPRHTNTGATNLDKEYSCCRGTPSTPGCTTAKLHVWNGVSPGLNGPLDGYVRTPFRKTPAPDGNSGIYALDCEMCYTRRGLELIRVTLVAADGSPVYDTLVMPENCIIDYNTRFSGITETDLREQGTKSLRDVQNDLMQLINADTILVGHGLENDLRALRIIHGTVIDTSVVFPHKQRLPYRRSLKSLVSCLLKKDIQQGSSGHCSYEDASACIELMLWRIRMDFPIIVQIQAPYFSFT
jgi:RNA exonuclease 1